MKAFSGYEPKRSYVREQLPVGGYVVKIMDVKPVHNDWGDILLLSFDVEEGDKKGFFRDDYRGQTYEDKKWRGTYRLRIPCLLYTSILASGHLFVNIFSKMILTN